LIIIHQLASRGPSVPRPELANLRQEEAAQLKRPLEALLLLFRPAYFYNKVVNLASYFSTVHIAVYAKALPLLASE